jgi:hypothetical protein
VLPISLVDSVTAKVEDVKNLKNKSKTNKYIYIYIYIFFLHTLYTSGMHHFRYCFNTVCNFLHDFSLRFIHISYTFKVKMKVRKWRPEKLKMVKKHFSPEMSRDLWGVICYHHWYLRAGSEPQNKYYSKKVLILKMMQNYPLSIFHASVWPESSPGADLSTFEKIIARWDL